jgi:hypothetical protein
VVQSSEHVDVGTAVVAFLRFARDLFAHFASLALAFVLFRAVTLARDLLQPFHRLKTSRRQRGRSRGDRVNRVDRSAHPHDTAGALTGSTCRRTVGGGSAGASASEGALRAATSNSCSLRLISITTNRRHTNRAAAQVTT